MPPTITAFESSPDRGQGLARDMRIRWAFEEIGQPYDVRLVSFRALKEPPHLALNPFGQIPTYEDDGVALFETGAILLHLGQAHPGLLPTDPDRRARAITWMFASVATVEQPIVELSFAYILERRETWFEGRLPGLKDRVRDRLGPLAAYLHDADWLVDAFSAADIMMVHVIRRLTNSGMLDEYPILNAYISRAEARPAYQRAFAAQLAVFEASKA